MYLDLLTAEEAKQFTPFLPPVHKWWWTKSTALKNIGRVFAVCDNAGHLIACNPDDQLGLRFALRGYEAQYRETFVFQSMEFMSLGMVYDGTGSGEYLAVSKRLYPHLKPFDKKGCPDFERSSLKACLTQGFACLDNY